MVLRYALHESPLGPLLLVGDDRTLTGLYLPDHLRGPAVAPGWVHDDARFVSERSQLDDYFSGRLEEFEIPIGPQGTPFQRSVWDQLALIPYGQTSTYGEIARRLGRPSAARAVGAACGRNPISIVVPCHRMRASSGGFAGYAGGIPRKRFLQELETR